MASGTTTGESAGSTAGGASATVETVVVGSLVDVGTAVGSVTVAAGTNVDGGSLVIRSMADAEPPTNTSPAAAIATHLGRRTRTSFGTVAIVGKKTASGSGRG